MTIAKFQIFTAICAALLAMPLYASEEKEAAHKPKIFSGFGAFSKKFTSLCEEISKDGRRVKFREIVAANDVKDLDCIACKPLFNSIKIMCGDKPAPKKKGEENISVPKAQRDPHINVIRVASDIATSLAQDKKRLEDIGIAVRRFSKTLREYEKLTPGEKDYFEVLASIFESPFPEAEVHETNSDAHLLSDEPQVTADDLFEE